MVSVETTTSSPGPTMPPLNGGYHYSHRSAAEQLGPASYAESRRLSPCIARTAGRKSTIGARFCEYCGRAIAGRPPSAGRVVPVHSGDTSDAIEGSRKARTWIWVACGAGLLVALFSARFVVLLLDATSWDVAPSEANVAVVEGSSPSTRAPTGHTTTRGNLNGRPRLTCPGGRSTSKPSIPTSPTKVPTGGPLPEQPGRPTETDMSGRSSKASKPSIPTSSLPLDQSRPLLSRTAGQCGTGPGTRCRWR